MRTILPRMRIPSCKADFPVEQLETVTQGQALEEELFLGLRQLAGIDLSGIESKYGANCALACRNSWRKAWSNGTARACGFPRSV